MAIEHMYQRFFLDIVILHRTFTIPTAFLTKKRQAVTLLVMRVCVCVCVCVYVCVRVLVLARARTPNESAYVVPPRQLLIVLHHVLQAVFLSSSVICLPVYCTYTCQLETSNIYVLKNQGGDIARSK